MIETLWQRHYHPGVTGEFHGDMALAFRRMLDDPDLHERLQLDVAVRVHKSVESSANYGGRKWFCETFPN